MANLSTTYMGIKLKSPIIAGACGLTSNFDMIKELEKSGAGAIVCKSLFEEQIQMESLKFNKDIHEYDNMHPEGLTLFPDLEEKGPDYHLYWVKKVKESCSIPVFASLNAVNEEVWLEYAKKLEQTGVDGIELNFYAFPSIDGDNSLKIEENQITILKKIRKTIDLPICVKLSPYYTNPSSFIKKLDDIGIDGFVLFNRLFQANIDINREKFTLPFNFSNKVDNRLTLRFTGLLAKNIKGSICSSNGIIDSDDVIRMILAGADATQVVSTLYRNGPTYIETLLNKIAEWMDDKQYSLISDFKGKMSFNEQKQKDSLAYKRAQYVQMLMQPSEILMNEIM